MFSSTRKSPSIRGMLCILRPAISFWDSIPSPKNLSLKPTLNCFSASGMPLNTAVVGAVRTHCPSLSKSWCSRISNLKVQIWMYTPGLPSGVSSHVANLSIPASAGHMITEVPKPVASVAATSAQRFVAAVINTLPILIGKASAKVSSISTPLISIVIPFEISERYIRYICPDNGSW